MVVALVAIVLAGRAVVIYTTEHGPSHNDPATLAQLRSRFTPSTWVSSLVSAHWDSSDDLDVRLDSDDRRIALAACADLIDVVIQGRPTTGPGGVAGTVTTENSSLFIGDRLNNIMVSNLPDQNSGCQWRLN